MSATSASTTKRPFVMQKAAKCKCMAKWTIAAIAANIQFAWSIKFAKTVANKIEKVLMWDGFKQGDFATEGIRFGLGTYEEYLEAVEKHMRRPETLFPNRVYERFRVPPVYRDRALAELKGKYPQYEMHASEVSGIMLVAPRDIFLREAVRQVERKARLLFACETGQHTIYIVEELRKRFPDKRFQINDKNEVEIFHYLCPNTESIVSMGAALLVTKPTFLRSLR